MARFRVDTQLFRELGELLVGRDSTALVELIKNAYDADARTVIVTGKMLDDTVNGYIEIDDNGTGMTRDEFECGFLTIATRIKNKKGKRSPVLGRRYTGEKGVGRLALHKLAKQAEIRSYKVDKPLHCLDDKVSFISKKYGIKAKIDWDLVEEVETIDDIDAQAIDITRISRPSRNHRTAGTRLRLSRLRRQWNDADIKRFHDDVATLVPPMALVSTPNPDITIGKRLFVTPRTRDSRKYGDNFDIILLGDLAYQEEMIANSLKRATWLLEIDSDTKKGRTKYSILPSKTANSQYDAAGVQFSVPISENHPNLSFQARIYQQSNHAWPKRFQGIRIYMEGFRVLPYGEPTDDWLRLAFDYSRRTMQSLIAELPHNLEKVYPGLKGESQVIQSNQAYFGGIFLTKERSPGMQMLINREGFLPSETLESVSHKVRLGINMLTRVRYRETIELKRTRIIDRKLQCISVAESDARQAPSVWRVGQHFSDAKNEIASLRNAILANDIKSAKISLNALEKPWRKLERATEEFATEQSMFRVLASVGTQFAAFSHEVNGLLEHAIGLERMIEQLLDNRRFGLNQKISLQNIFQKSHALRQSLERQATYLIDITSADTRRRRSRLRISEHFDSALKLVESPAKRMTISIDYDIPKNLRSPPMFPAELTAVFTNLLSNAVKFAGKGGEIYARAEKTTTGTLFRIENTGVPVNPRSSNRWFEPFISTTTSGIDARLGQGMGLGLTITRAMLDEYGATIKFKTPERHFKAAVQIQFPDIARKVKNHVM